MTKPYNKDHYRTPLWLFKFAESVCGPFDLDVAASKENSLCDWYCTEEEDAFEKEWKNPWIGNVWCNPPGEIGKWVERAIEQAKTHSLKIAMLLPSPRSNKYEYELINNCSELYHFAALFSVLY